LRLKEILASPSKVAKANTNSKSLRATIPEDVVEELKVKPGDLLIWSTEERKGKRIATVERWEK